ncbi:MAG: hypothetical protein HYV07_32765 [Deltaproteobacteria bacterium]|nr:hypothetical protein [Deltaproteobacteria bacterium]
MGRGRAKLAMLALLSCAPSIRAPDGVRPVWPASPARPRVRWLGEFPTPGVGAQRSLFVRVLEALIGLPPELERPALRRPFGVALHRQALYVTDPDAGRVLRVDWRQGDATDVICSERPWQAPLAVAVDGRGALYVADPPSVLRVLDSACEELGRGLFQRPSGIVASDVELFVVDPPQHRVLAFGLDGHFRRAIGARGPGPDQLNYPVALAFSDETLFIVDTVNQRVARFSPTGQPRGSIGAPGDAAGGFARPKSVAVTADGGLFVTDGQLDSVVAFDAAGRFIATIGSSGTGPGQLSVPTGLAYGEGYLFVADSMNRRVQIFEVLETP